ncbi:unconventional myosin-Ih-like [Scleropages formosus]|uniref:Unconventional myosin-Ih-like n=1 Tax=Scleropages formosus TaxID=113540 RepID=A0A0P7XGK2_SCLFO|nr:unconventional myosin-Ih-like [Scleropages formosus]
MEGALVARDQVGIQDFVLLDSITSETAFLDNLKKRFNENLIYTYIGTLLVSVNPYKELGIYTKKQMENYMGVNFFELPPHIYALADNAYHTMLTEMNNHFILISGESGAGKTEASKRILQFYAVSCPSTSLLDRARDRMLVSNPVLEAFGNAKTLKNDNSSRFGKYMDIQFNREGEAVGGHILSYLLEKSRVVYQNHGERNFHIFYQLVEGGEEETLRLLGLERNCQHYCYLVQGEGGTLNTVNYKNDWKTMQKALFVLGFSEKETEVRIRPVTLKKVNPIFHSIAEVERYLTAGPGCNKSSIPIVMQYLFGIIGSILHLGNVQFEADSKGYAHPASKAELRWVSKLLGVHVQVLQEALTFKKIEAKTEEVLSPFSVDHAIYARDALTKALYDRTFTWLVNKINESLENKDSTKKTVIGLLDIYGFEVFYVNSEVKNGTLPMQLFIQLTLKSEQEEYEAEDIEWEPVQFFNNRIICDLVEQRHSGIISILDEECMRPGEATDLTFLERLEERLGNHPHFVTHRLADQKTRKTMDRGDFRLLHYAGEVTYCVVGFIDKNNDLLYRNIKDVMHQAKNSIVKHCFPPTEADSKKRPETVATQFKSSLMGLTKILTAKEPWYVRCLKSNEDKQPGRFDHVLVRHQVKYLGLMEHLRVRRAGFAYRRRYEVFLHRYKPLCPATWPHWRGVPADGVERILKHLGYSEDEYKMGRTKIFIRHPRTLFAIEDAYEICKHELAAKIQAKYKGYKVKGEYRKKKEAATKIETCWRGVQARKEREKRAWAVKASEMLRKLHMRLMVRKYVRGITAAQKTQLQLKGLTSELFKGKKDSYPQSVSRPFVDTRLSEQDINMRVLQMIRHERIKYSIPVVKYDRNGFKPRPRQLILTQTAAYLVEEAKMKQRIEYRSLKGVSVSNLSDGILILHVMPDSAKKKGDLVLQCDHLFEAVTKLCVVANKRNIVKVVQGSIKFDIQPGKEGFVDFGSGQEAMAYKAKNGHLMVVSASLWCGCCRC